MHTIRLLLPSFLIITLSANAQDDGYKTPPKAITDMLLAKPTPNVSVDDKGQWMLFTESSSYPSVEELAKPELRLAGYGSTPTTSHPAAKTSSTLFT